MKKGCLLRVAIKKNLFRRCSYATEEEAKGRIQKEKRVFPD
jgi:hypothetical protein